MNANQNVKKILVEPQEPTIVVLIRGIVVTGDDRGEPWKNMRIWPTILKNVQFDVEKEKWIFFDAQHEFVDRNHASTSADFSVFDEGPIIDMPPSFDQSIPNRSKEKVNILKSLLKSCLALAKDEHALVDLSTLIEECRTNLQWEKNIHHIIKEQKLVENYSWMLK